MATMEKNNLKLLKFWATYCGPCKQQTKHFEENPLDINIISIDIDNDEEELTNKYKVKSIPTLILLDNLTEKEINRWIGFTTTDTINEFINGRQTTSTEDASDVSKDM